jgi:hypothetical protein
MVVFGDDGGGNAPAWDEASVLMAHSFSFFRLSYRGSQWKCVVVTLLKKREENMCD